MSLVDLHLYFWVFYMGRFQKVSKLLKHLLVSAYKVCTHFGPALEKVKTKRVSQADAQFYVLVWGSHA